MHVNCGGRHMDNTTIEEKQLNVKLNFRQVFIMIASPGVSQELEDEENLEVQIVLLEAAKEKVCDTPKMNDQPKTADPTRTRLELSQLKNTAGKCL